MRHYNIPIFVPHKGCPHDCIFCNQHRITASEDEVTYDYVIKTVEEYLKSFTEEERIVEIAFFGGSFTAIEIEKQNELLQAANTFLSDNRVDGIRLSTRPDAIDRDILDNLKRFGVTTIELGVQSMCEDVLISSNRGYLPEVVFETSKLIKEYGCFSLGLQMMTGLLGDTREKSIYTCEKICEIKPDFVRIYPTLVVRDTALAVLYARGEYLPESLEEAVELSAFLKERFLENNIEVIRVSLQTTDEISPGASVIAGPFHSAFGELVDNAIFYKKMLNAIKTKNIATAHFAVNKSEISKAVGNGKRNVNRMYDELGIRLIITADETVKSGDIRLLEVN